LRGLEPAVVGGIGDLVHTLLTARSGRRSGRRTRSA
jgi:hypothetical protein